MHYIASYLLAAILQSGRSVNGRLNRLLWLWYMQHDTKNRFYGFVVGFEKKEPFQSMYVVCVYDVLHIIYRHFIIIRAILRVKEPSKRLVSKPSITAVILLNLKLIETIHKYNISTSSIFIKCDFLKDAWAWILVS